MLWDVYNVQSAATNMLCFFSFCFSEMAVILYIPRAILSSFRTQQLAYSGVLISKAGSNLPNKWPLHYSEFSFLLLRNKSEMDFHVTEYSFEFHVKYGPFVTCFLMCYFMSCSVSTSRFHNRSCDYMQLYTWVTTVHDVKRNVKYNSPVYTVSELNFMVQN